MNTLLELGCEEIPARFMPGLLADLKMKAEEKLRRERIGFGKIETIGTSRRLVLSIENIAARQEDLSEEIKGPPADIAFDKEGNGDESGEKWRGLPQQLVQSGARETRSAHDSRCLIRGGARPRSAGR